MAGTDDWAGFKAEELIHQADVALYRAKEAGRNHAVLALRSAPQGSETADSKEAPVPAA